MTDRVKLRGKVKWAHKLYEPDVAFGASKFKVSFYPENDEEFKKLKASGIQKKINEDADGKFIELVRDSFKTIKGEIVNFPGPTIVDAEGGVIVDYVNTETGRRAWSYSNAEKDKIHRRGKPLEIGNGSTVEVTVSVYDTSKGKGHRLEEVKVLDLIEYIRPAELPPLSTQFNKAATEEIDTESKKTLW